MSYSDQANYDVRFEWGLAGLEHLLTGTRTVIIVDVLSFSTAVEVAVARGAVVYPFDKTGDEAAAYARNNEAMLAVGRTERDKNHCFSLSPISLIFLKEGDRLVLPSPNGATLSFRASESSTTVIAGCLRNAEAVAEYVRGRDVPTLIIAAGEKWNGYDGPLRPAAEDLIGAGAIIDRLASLSLSPEAETARGAYREVKDDLTSRLLACSSGRELAEAGFDEDVRYAAQIDVSQVVPILRNRRFEAASPNATESN